MARLLCFYLFTIFVGYFVLVLIFGDGGLVILVACALYFLAFQLNSQSFIDWCTVSSLL